MTTINAAAQTHCLLPANVPSRGNMLLGVYSDLKDGPGVEDSSAVLPTVANPLLVEQVAKVLAGIPAIGSARRALEEAGWRATIAGNRITVNYEVFAQFIAAAVGPSGDVDASWVVYTVVGTPPVWIVGAEHLDDTVDDHRPEHPGQPVPGSFAEV